MSVLPRPLYPVAKGLLFGADGSVWSLFEDEHHEYVSRLDPALAQLECATSADQVASWELSLLSPN